MRHSIEALEFEAFLLLVKQSIGQQGGKRAQDSPIFNVPSGFKTGGRSHQAAKSSQHPVFDPHSPHAHERLTVSEAALTFVGGRFTFF
jgi:hypothetical protein